MTRGETWKRTVGQEYTLHLSQTSEGSLVLPSEVAHGHNAVVQFEPPLSYLIVGLAPWETRVFAGKMEVYSSSDLSHEVVQRTNPGDDRPCRRVSGHHPSRHLHGSPH